MTRIGSKLLLTYFLLIISIFLVMSVSFRIISQRYLIQETEQQLEKEAKVMSTVLSASALSNELVQEKASNRKALAVSERLLSSKMIIWKGNKEIIYTDMKSVSLKQLGNKQKFVTETAPIVSKSGKTKGYVTLIAELDDIQKLNQAMRKSQLISLVISAVIAVVLGIIFEKGLTRPIRMLTYNMKNFSLKGNPEDIPIQTKDEIGELAASFNALSRTLRKYDQDQKTFFHNASHELKTPLMAIQGNAEGILDGVVKGDDIPASLQVIVAESQRLKRIVEGITFLAKLENTIESFTFQEESMKDLFEEAVRSVQALADQKGIHIWIENHINEPVRVDRDKIIRALINLLGNAIRYANTKIVLSGIKSVDGDFIIKIEDDGNGIAEDKLEKIFQRFYSSDDGGSGIGLTITKTIIEAHHGSIIAYSRNQGGAVFEIRLNSGA